MSSFLKIKADILTWVKPDITTLHLHIHPNSRHCDIEDIEMISKMVKSALDAFEYSNAKVVALNGIQMHGNNQVTNKEIANVMLKAAENWIESGGQLKKIYFVDLRGGFDITQ